MLRSSENVCCVECFAEPEIEQFIEVQGQIGDCDYCGSSDVAVGDVAEVGRFVLEGFHRCYEDAVRSVGYDEGDYGLPTSTIEEILSEYLAIFDLDDPTELLTNLVEPDGTAYVRRDPYGPRSGDPDEIHDWDKFSSLVKGQRRFTAFLKLPDQSAWTKHPSDVLGSVVRIVGRQTYDLVPGQKLYRARIHSGDGVFCHKDLTSAPPEKALNNRMSPAGISFFYGSDEAHTCLAEVRPSVVDTVVVGEFKVLKELRMLDLFTEVGVAISIFSELYSFLDEEYYKPFLRHFIREISRPVHPSEEQTEYVPTQVFTEFLKAYTRLRNQMDPYRYDGFSFRSSLVTEGANVVLFRGSDISLTEGYEDTDEPWLKYNGSTSYRITSVDLQAERIKWPGVEGKTKI